MFEVGSSYSLWKDCNGKVGCPIVRSGIYNQKLVVIYVYSCDDVYIIVDVDLQLDGLLRSCPFRNVSVHCL